MITALNIFLGIVAAVLLFGIIGEPDPYRQRNITRTFAVVVALIIALNTIM